MADPSEPSGSRAVSEWTSAPSGLPTVIYAPPPSEPSVTRGVTGLFVPIFLGVFILVAIYFYAGAWNASQRLARQQAVTREAAGMSAYIDDLERQNVELCMRLGELPERVERPSLQVQLQEVRRNFDAQCRENERLVARLGQSASAGCIAATPPARSEPAIVATSSGMQRRETVAEFRARICRSYVTSGAPR